MRKILFITTRNPYSGRLSGDVIRSLKIINLLKKKYYLDIICLEKEKINNQERSLITFNQPNLILKFIYCLVSLLRLNPVQFGLFYSGEMKRYVENFANNYDYLFFYHIRSSQYLPKNFYGKTIIEMGDLYSDNYFQTFKYLNFFNPLKYVYYFESLLVKRIENQIFENFDKIVLFSKKEIEKVKKKFKNKIFKIEESVEKISKKFFFSKKNFRILFVGNLNYLPNLLACRDFITQIFPKIKPDLPKVKFTVIGSVSKFKKNLLSKLPDVEIIGSKKDLSKYIKNSICGLANLKIATGMQGKVLTYMSYGLPVISSEKVSQNFGLSVLSFKNNSDLIKKINDLKKNKVLSNRLSKKSLQLSKQLIWSKVSRKYYKLLDFNK